jgi:hypothetical protein
MTTNISQNPGGYYVFGAGANASQLSHIGIAEHPPEQQSAGIFSHLAACACEPVRQWAASALAGGLADAFELERCDTLAEAEEAVACWRSYFQYLGLSLIETPQPA